MFHCPRCGTIKKKRVEIYEHFESDPPCHPSKLNISYDIIRKDYDVYCETFEEMIAQSKGYRREGIPIRTILQMVNNIKTFLVIQDREIQINHDELTWALDIAFSRSGRKIYENYDDIMAKVVSPDANVPDPLADLEEIPAKLGGYPPPPPGNS